MTSLKRTLQFSNDKTFRIMQIADIQENPEPSVDTIKLIEAALDQGKPDFVVLTGDQLQGYNPSYRKDAADKIKQAITAITLPLVKRNIPFAVTYGNHDYQAGLSNQQQDAIYQQLPNFQQPQYYYSAGTCAYIINSNDSDKPAIVVYLIDSGVNKANGGYNAISYDVIDWFKETAQQIKQQYQQDIPSIVFMHIPLQEYYQALKVVNKKTPNSHPGYRIFDLNYYTLPADAKFGGNFNESVCCADENSGFFMTAKKYTNLFAIYNGHDHKNSFVINHQGVDLGYSPGCGFNTYGPGIQRGTRLFEFNQDQPQAYHTEVLRYQQLIGNKASKPFIDYLLTNFPSNPHGVKKLIRNITLILVLIIAVVYLWFNH